MSFSSSVIQDASTGASQNVFSKSLGSTYDVFYANHVPQVYKRFGNQFYDTLAFLQSMGRIEPVDTDLVTLHEENRYHTYVTLGSGAATTLSANTTASIAIAANSYVRVGDVLAMSADGSKLARVMVYNSTTSIDICPIGAGTIVVTNNQICPIVSSLFKDATGQPLAAVAGYSKTTFTPSIIKETVGINGRELVMGTWFGDTFWSPTLMQGEYRQSLKIGNAMLLGQPVDHSGGDPLADYISTKGLIPTIKSRGGNHTYTAGSLTLAELDDISLYMLQNGVTSNVICALSGHKFVSDFSDAAHDFLVGTANGISQNAFVGAAKDIFPNISDDGRTEDGLGKMALDFNFKVVQLYNTTYIIKTENAFINPMTLGATGMNFTNSSIMFPLASIADAKDGSKKFNNVSIRPLAKNGYNRFMETWKVGAAGGDHSTYVNDTDALAAYWRSDFMMQIAGANQMVYVEKS